MSEYEIWVIIRNGNNKVKTIDFSGYEHYEWAQFETLKKEGNYSDPVMFDSYREAVDFIFETFERAQIAQDLLNEREAPDGYHW